jgi:hypothetical protein
MKEGFESNTLSLEEFNKKYDADIVGLPIWLFALGVEDGKYHTYSKLESYAETLIEYWMEHISPSLPPKYYVIVCPMDGIGNNGDMMKSLTELKVTNEMIPSLKDSIGHVVGNFNTNNYLVFHSKRRIYAMSKNVNDPTTVLIPDAYYIREKAYEEKKNEIDLNRTPYPKRISECIWRGTIGNGNTTNFMIPRETPINQREYFKKLYEEGRFPKVQFEDRQTSISDQIKYKMILDIDGCSSTWSATVWKLYSGSVLLKQKSKWKQWFYDDMEPWVHYVPVENDFSDLNDKIEWCLHNEETCIEITENAHRFVLEKLNWERVKEDTIATVLASMEENI